MHKSEIAEYYKDKFVFVTGGTGFLGKVLIEKLLRSCPNIKRIYVLVRHKKGKTPQQRIDEILDCPLFDGLKKSDSEFKNRLEAIEGDLVLSSLGISTDDRQKLIDNVNIVFHSAATVRFDEPLKVAVRMNIEGTKKVVDLCKQIANLEAFVHVSTAYANCNQKHIKEQVYDAVVLPNNILNMSEWIADDVADTITPSLIDPWPNTYTYTKAIAESLVKQECLGHGIPCAIVRPSIVCASWRGPFPGWVDNFNGLSGFLPASGKGVLRTVYCEREGIADLLPVDFSVNTMIVAGWATGAKKAPSGDDNISVYNNTTGQLNTLTWGNMGKIFKNMLSKNPFENVFRVPNTKFTNNRMLHNVRHFFEELLVAYMMDLYMKIIGKKPIFVRIQHKLAGVLKVLEYFATHEWEFDNHNMLHLQEEMNETDRELFNIDVRTIDWSVYIDNYCKGIKKYLLKEDMSKEKKCQEDLKKVSLFTNVVWILVGFILLKLIWTVLESVMINSSNF